MTKALIEEVVVKECERYKLEMYGFVKDRTSLVNLLANSYTGRLKEGYSTDDYRIWKERLLQEWYVGKGYAHFFCREIDKLHRYLLVKELMKNTVASIRRKCQVPTIDEELKIKRGNTVAFKMSLALFEGLYPEMCPKETLFVTPGQMEDHCNKHIKAIFPLTFPAFYERLKSRDNEFWKEILELVNRFVRQFIKEAVSESETVKDVSMETMLSLQEQMARGSLERITSASHLRYSLQTTCKYKAHEHWRREEQRQEELYDEEDWEQLERKSPVALPPEKDQINGYFGYLLDIDEENVQEVNLAWVEVLLFGKGKIYDELSANNEQTVEIMRMFYVEEMTYKEIAWKLYEGEEKLATLRKIVSRGKEYLYRRMKEMIIGYKKEGMVPFVPVNEE